MKPILFTAALSVLAMLACDLPAPPPKRTDIGLRIQAQSSGRVMRISIALDGDAGSSQIPATVEAAALNAANTRSFTPKAR